jgi:hypothetical protein
MPLPFLAEAKNMDFMKWIWITAGLLVVLAIAVNGISARHWNKSTQALVNRLYAAKAKQTVSHFSRSDLVTLPIPVQRYLRLAFKDGQTLITIARFSHEGTFNMSVAEPSWKPFTSNQTVVVDRPGFVWDAHMKMFPLINVNVHDAYISGEGILQASILGLFDVANMNGLEAIAKGEMKRAEAMAQCELLRFLAEIPLYPTSLLPHQGIVWEAIDEHSAKITLTEEKLQVSMTFRFNESGLIDTVWASARGRSSGKIVEYMPWQGRFWNYAERSGMLVPLEAEVEWLTPEGPKPYYRGKLTAISFEY